MKKNTGLFIATGILILGIILVILSFVFSMGKGNHFSNSFYVVYDDAEKKFTNADGNFDRLLYEASSKINSLQIEESSNRVEIVSGDVDKVTVEYSFLEKVLEYNIEEKDGTLIFERKPSRNYFSFNFGLGEDGLLVTVPEEDFENIKVHSSSGSIKLDGVNADSFDVKNSSGSIRIKDVTASDFNVENSSGSISVQDSTIENSSVKNTSGGITLENVSGEAVDVSTSSGSIHLDSVCATSVDANATSGGIIVDSLDCKKSITLKNSSGGIHGTIVGKESDFAILADTSSGSNNLNNSREGEKELTCETTSGSIHLQFND